MGLFADIDGQFHRAVDIVQSLPKGGSVQTSYEEKLWLYSLYKQATEGDISIPRPGMLDILGKAKWDAWNKQKGIDKREAKRLYVYALLKILRKHVDHEGCQSRIDELESFNATQGSSETYPPRPASPASSSSSYHSSQASPIAQPSPPKYNMLPPDPLQAPPDVAEGIVPPSALTSSHRSLLNLSQAHSQSPVAQPHEGNYPANVDVPHIASRTHSLAGERVTGGSIHSFRQGRKPIQPSHPNDHTRPQTNLGISQSQTYSHSPNLGVRDFIHHQNQIHTPQLEFPPSSSPYLGVNQPHPGMGGHTPIAAYPSRFQGPASTSTFTQAPLNLSINLQNIHTSLTALHERLSVLERNQSVILRLNERKRQSWFWNTTEEDELDALEDDLRRDQYPSANRASDGQGTTQSHITVTRVKRKRGKLSVRLMWYLLTTIRRAVVDVSVGLIIMVGCIVVLGGGWRRARWTLGVLQARFQRYLTEGL
ncbi:uncharacterized protein I303_105099 [Kwoniella dejecticola CBS 10117]|uniref:ACB domain-containing protein n=1 Tax=Kwoniella dejecticola CBS 10117 TaxID=1296121 RepID=A0A1A6A3G3_9TREE|nr:uncharacterized protein I303_05456 [Kwoniella dejecticola CBS 10117]OBR84597.1 hypothetical protein I303_05456 [Kwoniella dejecticola CBS 10117]